MDVSKTDPACAAAQRIALMWRADPIRPEISSRYADRLKLLASNLLSLGVATIPIVWSEEAEPAVCHALQSCDGVMVWINPLADGRDRGVVDRVLRAFSKQGGWVSAHPDIVAKMATKEVLYTTRALGWGSDTDLYSSFADFAARFEANGRLARARVLKPLRGNDGQGVIKVHAMDADIFMVQSASDDRVECVPRAAFMRRMEDAFSRGALVDQAFHDNVGAGMVRCYMTFDRVAGFSEQQPRAELSGSAPVFGMASAKQMHAADAPRFAGLRRLMEEDWTPGLQRILNIETVSLPALWDADFLLNPSGVAGSGFVLCEINASSVSPFPPEAAPLVAASVARLLGARAAA